MTVYIEYAFLENFLLDGVLLSLSLLAARASFRWWRVSLSAVCGAVFALIYPFIRLPELFDTPLKLAAGALLCLLAHGRLKNKKEWGRYALTCTLFFAFSFGFGGALIACTGGKTLQNTPVFAVLLGFGALSVIVLLLIKKLYEKRAAHAYIYPCMILYRERKIPVDGFLDSGNRATNNGVPVCFLAPDVFYEIWGESVLFQKETQEEMQIVTMTGERKIPLYLAGLQIKTKEGILR
ncbi:MAG: sigma-E processing peptidase SpoIIGA, partial [Clostridia bacterium]|nr:sigma-E processing peptidase SpoIIGA [Clostridia bacterium]